MDRAAIQIPVTFIVLTRNEERNLAACLSSVHGWTSDIFVVDSGSSDGTLKIAEAYDAKTFLHPFETHSKQWGWALNNLPIRTEWVLALDADQRVTPELYEEILRLLNNDRAGEINGCYVKRKQIFRGRWIRHGGYYPKYLLKLFRRDYVWTDEGDLVDHHFRVRGETSKLNGDIIEDNRNEADISTWIEKHNRYASLQAREDVSRLQKDKVERPRASLFGTPDERVLRLKEVWDKLPLYVRPFLYFVYRYILRLGFLDGKQGFIFHFLQGFWYRLLIDIKLDELRQELSVNGTAGSTSSETRGAVSAVK